MKNAICALTKGYDDLNGYAMLIHRNKSVYDLIHKKDPTTYDYILFHEGNILADHQHYIQSATPELPLLFIDVSDDFSPELNRTEGKYSRQTYFNSTFSFGYKCMCRFWFYGFLRYVKEYKYIIRIDEDCIMNTLPENVLQDMNNNHLHFVTATFCRGFNDGDCAYGMEELTREFMQNNNIQHLSGP